VSDQECKCPRCSGFVVPDDEFCAQCTAELYWEDLERKENEMTVRDVLEAFWEWQECDRFLNYSSMDRCFEYFLSKRAL
jgi:hypothetical protein